MINSREKRKSVPRLNSIKWCIWWWKSVLNRACQCNRKWRRGTCCVFDKEMRNKRVLLRYFSWWREKIITFTFHRKKRSRACIFFSTVSIKKMNSFISTKCFSSPRLVTKRIEDDDIFDQKETYFPSSIEYSNGFSDFELFRQVPKHIMNKLIVIVIVKRKRNCFWCFVLHHSLILSE